MSTFFSVPSGVAAALTSYPWAVMCAVLWLLWLVAWWLAPRQRRAMIVGSMLAWPQALAGLALDPEYWHPRHVRVLLVGVEDIAYQAVMGGLAWAVVVLPVSRRVDTRFAPWRIGLCCLLYYLAGAAVFSVAKVIGASGMDAALLAMATLAAALLASRPRLWPMAVSGALAGLLACLTILKGALVTWPHLIDAWNAPNLWGYEVWGIPAEEFVWTGLYAPAWGLGLAWMLDARLAGE